MTDDIKIKLAAWGAWTKDLGGKGGCSSPAQVLINMAPFGDAVKRRARHYNIAFISDEDALQVDSAMCELRRYSARLDAALGSMLKHELDDDNLMVCALMYDTLMRYYRDDESLRDIAEAFSEIFNKRFTHTKIEKILERGVGWIDCLLAKTVVDCITEMG